MTGSNQLTFVRVFLLISIISIAAHHGFAASTSKYIPHSSNFVGEGTNELATALLQGFVNEERNFVFSPLGYSVILGVMAEGARGKTRGQLVEALHLPEDTTAVSGTYKSVLSSMKSCLLCTDENSDANDPRPQFKNWFYVYKNFSIHDNFRKVIEENYNTEVKSVESPDCYESEMKFTFSSFDTSGDKKDEVVEEEEEEEKKKKDGMKVETVVEEINKDGKVSEKKVEEMKVADMKEEKVKIEEMKEEKLKIEEMKESVEKVEEVKDEKMEEEKVKMEEGKRKTYVKEEDKIVEETSSSSVESETESSAPLSMEPISSLSVNRIAGKSKDGSEKNIHSKMITFNGLYYRGKWGLPVEKVANDSGDMTFYLSENDKKQVSMLRAQGMIESGKIDALNCDAVELPYEGGKYSMLLLLPNSNGLNKLIADMAGFSLSNIYKELSSAQSEVYFPKFVFQTISKPEQVLKKYGVEDIFTEEADLSGISENEGYFWMS
uniref:Serpin-5 n=1 Tax=Nilaparvata lugens TaxID=108931 RepID=M9ZZD8_NILLU|nr:serpin-5 [Nilaparvata lugens]